MNLKGVGRLSLKNVVLTVSGPVYLLKLCLIRLENCPVSETTYGIPHGKIHVWAQLIRRIHLISPHGIDVTGILNDAEHLKNFILNAPTPLTRHELKHLSVKCKSLESMTVMVSWSLFTDEEVKFGPVRRRYFSSLRIARLIIVEDEEEDEKERVRQHFTRVIWRNFGSANIEHKGALTVIRPDEDMSSV